MNKLSGLLLTTLFFAMICCAKAKKAAPVYPHLSQVGVIAEGANAKDISVGDDGYALLGLGELGAEVWSLNNPQLPVRVSSLSDIGDIKMVRRIGDEAFAIDEMTQLHRFDFSDLSKPRPINRYGLRQLHDVARDVSKFTLRGRDHIVIASQLNGLASYHEKEGVLISDGLVAPDSLGIVNRIEIIGNQVLAADYQDGVKLLDLADWPNVAVAASYSVDGEVSGFRIQGDLMIVSALSKGVHLVKTGGESEYFERHSVVNLPALAFDALVLNDYLVVAYDNSFGDYGLALYDITDLSQPMFAQFIETEGVVKALASVGGRIYAADSEGGVLIFEIQGG